MTKPKSNTTKKARGPRSAPIGMARSLPPIIPPGTRVEKVKKTQTGGVTFSIASTKDPNLGAGPFTSYPVYSSSFYTYGYIAIPSLYWCMPLSDQHVDLINYAYDNNSTADVAAPTLGTPKVTKGQAYACSITMYVATSTGDVVCSTETTTIVCT